MNLTETLIDIARTDFHTVGPVPRNQWEANPEYFRKMKESRKQEIQLAKEIESAREAHWENK